MNYNELVHALKLKGITVIIKPLENKGYSIQDFKLIVLSDKLSESTRVNLLKEFLENYS